MEEVTLRRAITEMLLLHTHPAVNAALSYVQHTVMRVCDVERTHSKAQDITRWSRPLGNVGSSITVQSAQ